MDLKEKLINLIEAGRGCPDDHDPFGTCEDCRYFNAKDCFNERLADRLLANGVTVQEWIPVTERLPDENGYFLCYWRGHRHLCKYQQNHSCFEFNGRPVNVTHWMPLPELPKGD